eukprot:TRINITY_DN3382_c0_g1_i1.p1 TRINITY_DN3382_c0_g1~~TRINITY_DN3382_c0_g1_i1.p1  ORF type:complete len:538 (-),score=133.74 TRINITY_DN3382_c0_g1_i1:96-1709(-)
MGMSESATVYIPFGKKFVGLVDKLKPIRGTFIYDHSNSFWLDAEANFIKGYVSLTQNSNTFRYVGELCNGLQHGRGYELENGSKKYEGEYVKGEINGKGVLYDNGSIYFQGIIVKGVPKFGFFLGRRKQIYQGTFELISNPNAEASTYQRESNIAPKHNLYCQGYAYNISGYIVEIKGRFNIDNFLLDGFYTIWYKDGSFYKGHMKNNIKCGEGVFYQKDGSKFVGVWSTNNIEGIIYWSEAHNVLKISKGIFTYSDNGGIKMESFGQVWYKNGDYLEGEFSKGNLNGQGRKIFVNQDIYQGDFKNSGFDGKGVIIFAKHNAKYVGEFQKNHRKGFGELFISDELIYEGVWDHDVLTFGTKYFHGDQTLLKYEGRFKKVAKENAFEEFIPVEAGIYYLRDGSYIEAQIPEDEEFPVFGQAFYSNGDEYIGELKDGKRKGYGKLFHSKNYIWIEGIWDNDVLVSQTGVIENPEVWRYHGEISNQMADGFGTLENIDESYTYSGCFQENKRHGKGILTKDGVRILEEFEEDNLKSMVFL